MDTFGQPPSGAMNAILLPSHTCEKFLYRRIFCTILLIAVEETIEYLCLLLVNTSNAVEGSIEHLCLLLVNTSNTVEGSIVHICLLLVNTSNYHTVTNQSGHT